MLGLRATTDSSPGIFTSSRACNDMQVLCVSGGVVGGHSKVLSAAVQLQCLGMQVEISFTHCDTYFIPSTRPTGVGAMERRMRSLTNDALSLRHRRIFPSLPPSVCFLWRNVTDRTFSTIDLLSVDATEGSIGHMSPCFDPQFFL